MSIIGGIVVGSAAVEAGLISPIALICVSIAGICGFVMPNRDFAASLRVCRYALAILASIAGLTGVAIGFLLLVLHLLTLKSLGVPYVVFFAPKMLRQRLIKEKHRDKHLHPKDARKQR